MDDDDYLVWNPEFFQKILNDSHSAWKTIFEATKESIGEDDAEKICTAMIRMTLDDPNWSPYLH